MDYSESICVKAMTRSLLHADCEFQPFSQAMLMDKVASGNALGEGGKGICHGLAVTWLESMVKDGGDFLGQVADLKGSPLFYRAYISFRRQEGYRTISGKWEGPTTQPEEADVPRLVKAAKGPAIPREVWDKETNKYFGNYATGYIEWAKNSQGADIRSGAREKLVADKTLVKTGKKKSFGLSLAQMESLCFWLGAASGNRYFLVSIPGHSMAAVSANGKYRFFDPNCGIVSSRSMRSLAKGLYLYFSSPEIKVPYKTDKAEWLTAEKFTGYFSDK
jgi:hypothetical protein